MSEKTKCMLRVFLVNCRPFKAPKRFLNEWMTKELTRAVDERCRSDLPQPEQDLCRDVILIHVGSVSYPDIAMGVPRAYCGALGNPEASYISLHVGPFK